MALLITLYLVFRSTTVQTLLVRVAADYFSKTLNTEIRIKGFDLSLHHGVLIEGISVLDYRRDTLFRASELGVKPGMYSFKTKKINIRNVLIRDGLFQLLTHKGDSAINLQFILDHFASADTTPADTTPSKPPAITLTALILDNVHFRMQDLNTPAEPEGMDYSHLDIRQIQLELNNISFDEFSIHAVIRHLSARESCGINLQGLSGSFQVGSRFIKAKKLHLKTDHSDLSMDLDFLYEDWNAYNDFLNAVTIKARIDSSFLDMQDIGFFAPDLHPMDNKFHLKGNIRGTISNFKARDLWFRFGSQTSFKGDINMMGLPDISETFIDLNIKQLVTNAGDIEAIVLPGDAEIPDMPGLVEDAGVVSLKGKFTGFFNDFVANANLKTALGNVATDLALFRRPGDPLLHYKGNLSAKALKLGKISGNESLLGNTCFRAEINGKGLSADDADLSLDLQIDSLGFNRYNYRNINVSGKLADKEFKGNLDVNDPNLDFRFIGDIDMRDSIPDVDFRADIGHAQLFNLHLLERDSANILSTSLIVKMRGTNPDNLDGSVSLKNTTYYEGSKSITLDNLALQTRQDANRAKSYHLTSDFADADFTGTFNFSSLIPSLITFINGYIDSFNLNSPVEVSANTSNQELQYNIRIKDSEEVTRVFLPFIKISPGAVIFGSFDDQNGSLIVQGNAEKVNLSGFELNNWYLHAETSRENLEILTGAQSIYPEKKKEEDSVIMKLDSLLLISDIRHDSIIYNLRWTTGPDSSLIGGLISFVHDPLIEMKFTDFEVYLDRQYWNISPQNRIIIDSSRITADNLVFRTGEQYLSVQGTVSDRDTDTLTLRFNKVDISKVDKILGQTAVDLDGILQGKVQLVNPFNDLIALADLKVNKLTFNRELLGDAALYVAYDAPESRVNINADILYTGNIGTNIPLSLAGFVSLKETSPVLNLDLKLKNLNLKMFNPFIADFMAGLAGLASGEVRIRGNPAKPLLTGRLEFMRTEFKLNFLNVPYSFADVITIDTNAFTLRNVTLYDSLGHKSLVNGRITHQSFSNLALDLNVEMEDFSAYNNGYSRGSMFYGKARASGTVKVSGPVENLSIEVKATNGGKTHITIPIDLTRSVGRADYIIFVDPEQDSIQNLPDQTPRGTANTGLSLNLALRINDDAEVEVFFPEQLGNLKASGTGNLLMTMTPSTPFTLAGTYKLTKGFFLFQLKNYLRLPMSLLEGSSISWSGDPTDANISISAVYKTKAPLKGLTTETSLESTRIPVECIIRLSGKMMNPNISFSLHMPNVEESLKNQVYSVIDTNNAAVMTEQSFYLLVLNQFKPVVGGTSAVDMSGTAFSLVTNQLSSMISQVASNVSVNMNYKPGTASTTQEFDVGISTQLFDDRLLIDGTFGMNAQSANTRQTSTVVGDLNVEYILTRNRRWRVRAFNRTNTLTILNNNAPYTQGVGIKYQRDFFSFPELLGIGRKKE